MYRYQAKVTRVVDGDTLDLDVDLGMDIHHNIRVRLAHVNTPETYGVKKGSEEYKAGIRAKEEVERLTEGKTVVIDTIKDKKGKYGRYLAYVYLDPEDLSRNCLNDHLLKEGFATPY